MRRNARSNRRWWSSTGVSAPFDPDSTTPFSRYRGDSTDTATNFDWTDLTGNGRTLRQATAADKPTIVQPAEIGGMDALRFDGTSDFLASIAAASDYTFMHNGTGCSGMTLIIPRNALVAHDSILETYTGGANTAFRVLFGVTATTARFLVTDNAGAFAVDANITSAFAVDTPVLLSWFYLEGNSPEYSVRVDNGTPTTGSATWGTNAPAAPLNVGRRANGTGFGQFDIAELFIWNRLITPTENANMVAYFTGRYGAP